MSTASHQTGSPACSYTASAIVMDTLVTIEVAGCNAAAARSACENALRWFDEVEALCSRFEPDSEVMRLCAKPGVPTAVSELLFSVLHFGIELARLTDGAFDPAVGGRVAGLGFVESYKTGASMMAQPETSGASFRDIVLDATDRSVTLLRPLVLDLGALAKGFAMDLAARELDAVESYCIDAGGDILVKGSPGEGQPWAVGIQHPRHPDEVIEVLRLSSGAVCTSGDYERQAPDGASHIVDGRSVSGRSHVISATVVAPTAMAADGLSTAAMILGPIRGLELLREAGVEGLLVTRDLRRHRTPGFEALCR